jgi:shikimate dehydrogenase
MDALPVLPERLLGIVGHPLGHSLSPALHNWGFGQAGIPWVYLRWDLPRERLEGFMTAVRTLPIHGVSVTIPYKQAVIPFLDGVSDAAGRVGAVNTLLWDEGRLLGENTDVEGFVSPLERMDIRPRSALVLGAGGAARAVLIGLGMLGVGSIRVCSRNEESARTLAGEFGVGMLPWDMRGSADADLVINATPLGMKGRFETLSPWPLDGFPGGVKCVYDLVYNPEVTVLLRQARNAGLPTLGGLGMFVRQALAQFRLWTGLELDEPSAAAKVRSALGAQRT